jgi:hypothetical protein
MPEETAKRAYAFMVKCWYEKRGFPVTNVQIERVESDQKSARRSKSSTPSCHYTTSIGGIQP